jgi:hypothetical protein
MNRFRSLFVRTFGSAIAIAAVACCAANARADMLTQNELPEVFMTASASSGSQGLALIGTPTPHTGLIITPTALTIGNTFSMDASVGYFTGLSQQACGLAAFNLSVVSSGSFGNATLDSFLSASAAEQSAGAGKRSFYVLGK